tara:strand:- start:5975 stop:6172 length:198 start_codon:yes stop_codon:yes gene_type:complete
MYKISVDTHTYPNENHVSFAWCATSGDQVLGVGDAASDQIALEQASEVIRRHRDITQHVPIAEAA